MRIEVLYFDRCPHFEAVATRLQELLGGRPEEHDVAYIRVAHDADARRLHFLGSPTLRVNGRDVEPGAENRTSYGMQCRLYPASGRTEGTPSDGWILSALRRNG
jgi:hypothetical protein